MTRNALNVEQLLRCMANANRLLLLCHLKDGERTVGDLADTVGLQLPAASQHLAILRREGIVRARREGQQVYYSLARRDIREMIDFLYRTYCGDDGAGRDD